MCIRAREAYCVRLTELNALFVPVISEFIKLLLLYEQSKVVIVTRLYFLFF